MKINTGIALAAILTASTITTAYAAGPGADTYTSKCQMCHGAAGLGDTPAGKAMGAKPLNLPEFIKASDADLIAATKSGKGKMPAYAGKLTDPQIAEVIAYIRTLQKK
jgi:cytochrome c6